MKGGYFFSSKYMELKTLQYKKIMMLLNLTSFSAACHLLFVTCYDYLECGFSYGRARTHARTTL